MVRSRPLQSLAVLYNVAPQWPIVFLYHKVGFESASKSKVSPSKTQAVSKRTWSQCAIWNSTGFPCKCWQEILFKKARPVLTVAYHLSYIKTVSIFFTIICLLPSWHFRTALCDHISEEICFFVAHFKASTFSYSKNRPVSIKTFFIVWRNAMLRFSVIINSRYRVPGACFSSNLTGTSLGTVWHITSFLFLIHIKVTLPYFSKNMFFFSYFVFSFFLSFFLLLLWWVVI